MPWRTNNAWKCQFGKHLVCPGVPFRRGSKYHPNAEAELELLLADTYNNNTARRDCVRYPSSVYSMEVGLRVVLYRLVYSEVKVTLFAYTGK